MAGSRISPFVLAAFLCLMPGAAPAAGAARTPPVPPGAPPAALDNAAEPFGGETATPPLPDPLEPLNRAVFTFNDRAYFWVMKPVAQVYGTVVPELARVFVKNFFANIGMPIRFVNNLLQGKVRNAGVELLRFTINTTLGMGGLVDTADGFSLHAHNEDLGQTLGTYGLGQGFYLVLPLLGPSSLRDAAGLAGDAFLDPVNYVDGAEFVLAAKALKTENAVSLHIGQYEELKESSLDPYVSFRNGYAQYRANQVRR